MLLRRLFIYINLTVVATEQILAPACVFISVELPGVSVRVKIQNHDVPIENILLQSSDDLDIGRVPTVEVLPHRWIKRLKVEVLYQVGFESLSLALWHKLVK